MKHPALISLVLLTITAAPAFARPDEGQPEDPCLPDRTVDCYCDTSRDLTAGNNVRGAVALLKQGVAVHPQSLELSLLLARSYLDDGNSMWAMNTLFDAIDRHPSDCLPASWLAWMFIQEGAFVDARTLLESRICWETPPFDTRRQILLSLLADLEGNPDQAQIHLQRAARLLSAFPEDRAFIKNAISADPGYIFPFSGRVDLVAGYTSNAFAGTPTDLPSDVAEPSALGQGNIWLRLVAPVGRMVRPSLETDLRGLGYTAEKAQENSYMLMGVRPGFVVGWHPNAVIAYHYEGMLLSRGDRYAEAPIWFYAAHRGEFEMAPIPGLILFAGGGRRNFREMGRSRWEMDAGIGTDTSPLSWLRLMTVISARRYNADKASYDLWGGSALLHLDVRLPAAWLVRTSLVWGFDRYTDSAGYFDATAPDTDRVDVLIKPGIAVFTPPWRNALRLGVSYDYSTRFSTAAPYEYEEHRAMLKVQWSFAADPRLPAEAQRKSHVPMSYGSAGTDDTRDRIQDMLRQDEAAQRSSSCAN